MMRFLFESHPGKHAAGITVLRIITGIVFLVHGWQKVFAMGFAGVTGGFTQMGIPMPGLTGPVVAIVELLGGAALIIGFLTRLAALGLICDMMAAIALVHLKNGFFSPRGYEFPLMLLTAAVVLLIAGSGKYAVDDKFAARRSGTTSS
jgi:putative oxidoreductase